MYFEYAKPSDAEVRRILTETGMDVSGAHRFISDQRILHTLDGHGVDRETRKGQLPVTKEDFTKLPEYVRTADKISIEGRTKQGLYVIRYQKRVNGHIVVLEEHRQGKNILAFDSMWKFKA